LKNHNVLIISPIFESLIESVSFSAEFHLNAPHIIESKYREDQPFNRYFEFN